MHGLAFGQLSQPLSFKREHAPCQWPVMKEEGMNTFARYPGVPLLLYSFYRIENLAIKSVNVFRCSRVFTESDIMKGGNRPLRSRLTVLFIHLIFSTIYRSIFDPVQTRTSTKSSPNLHTSEGLTCHIIVKLWSVSNVEFCTLSVRTVQLTDRSTGGKEFQCPLGGFWWQVHPLCTYPFKCPFVHMHKSMRYTRKKMSRKRHSKRTVDKTF